MLSIIATLLVGGIPLLAIGYLIKYKKKYELIQEYRNYSIGEQNELIKNGYPQAIGQLTMNTGIMMISMIFLIIGMVYLEVLSVGIGILIGIIVPSIYLVIGSLFYAKLDKGSLSRQHRFLLIFSTIFILFIFGIIMISVALTK